MRYFDTHNDFFTKLELTRASDYLEKCESIGVLGLLCSVFTSETPKHKVFDFARKCATVLDCFGNKNYLLHIEDLGFASTLSEVEKIAELAPFSCSLTWNADNQFAGGNFGIGSLSKKGIAAIKLLQEQNIVLDTAHLNRKSFYAATKIYSSPIFCSHTGLNFIKKSPRNLSDTQVKTIIDSGGYFGLFLSPTFFTPNGVMNSDTFSQIIFKTMCKFGDNNFGLGSDFFGIGKTTGDLNSYADFEKVSNNLLNMGVPKQSIYKFFYGNFEKFLLETRKQKALH